MSQDVAAIETAANGQAAAVPEVRDVFSVVPRTLAGVMQFCELLAKSDLVPKDYHDKPANVLVALQCGAEVGLSPMQALQSIAVINGRPSLWGDAVLALVQASGKLEWIKEWHEGDTAYCETKRRGYPGSHKTAFSQADAAKMGLANKPGPWSQCPARMRQLRARAWNLRDQYADVLKGTAVAEEVIDIPAGDVRVEPEAPPPQTQVEKGAAVRARMQRAAAPAPSPAAEVVQGQAVEGLPLNTSTSGELAPSAWTDALAYLADDPDRNDAMMDTLKKFKVAKTAALLPKDRRPFLLSVQDELKRRKVPFQPFVAE